jgi:hypothetical protein
VVAAEACGGLTIGTIVLNDATADPSDPSRASNFSEICRRVVDRTRSGATQLAHGADSFSHSINWQACAMGFEF